MFCKNCGKEMKSNAKFCHECGAKVEQNEVVQTEQNTNVVSEEIVNPESKKKEDIKNTIIGLIAIGAIVIIVISLLSWLFGNGIEVDYGKYSDTDEVTLSGVDADYNDEYNTLTIKGKIKSKVDCYECIIVYFEVYNEYDRVITTCRIETDALSKGENYSFDEVFIFDSGSDVEKIKVSEVLIF